MANIKLNLPGAPFTGQLVTFPAPCGCDEVTDGLSINGEIYTIVDAMGNCVTGAGGTWCSGAQVSVALDVENKKAYLQNHTQGARIAIGSYVGTGKYGKDNPNILTFDFVPKVLWVGKDGFLNIATHPTSQHSNLNNQMLITCPEAAGAVPVYALNGGTLFDGTIRFSIDGKTVSWYGSYYAAGSGNEGSKHVQLNTEGETYHYFAIG